MSARAIDVGLLDPAAGAAAAVSDEALVDAMVDAEAALISALAQVGAAPPRFATGSPWRTPLTPIDAAAIAAASRGGGNPAIPLLAALRQRVEDDAASALHHGATSQDVVDTALVVVADRVRARIAASIGAVTGSLARLADEHRTTPVAGRTLGQHAAPTTFGLRISVLLDGILRAFDGLAAVELPAQLGGSVGTLAVLVDELGVERTWDVRRAYAERLGLIPRDGVWHVERGVTASLGTALAVYIGALGRLGLELAQLSRTELGEVDVLAVPGEGGSSAMPQKVNPVAAVLLVAAARRAPGHAATLLGAQLALDDRPSGDWHAEWLPLRDLLRDALDSTVLAAEALAGMRPNPERMRANLALSHGALHAERAQWALRPLVGAERAKALVADALTTDDFVGALLTALADDAGAVARVREVTAIGGPIGLSDRLIDAAVAAAGRRS